MKRKWKLFLGLFFFACSLWVAAQQSPDVVTAIDTTAVKIGAQINLSIQVKGAPDQMIEFPAEPIFSPFELLEESAIDTLRAQNHYLFTKRYALIQFDSGSYWIPPQKIRVDGRLTYSDSLVVEVATVEVDTLRQPLFDIKPIQEVERDYAELIQTVLTGFGILLLLVLLYVLVQQYLKRREALREEIPPFERALQELKALEETSPSQQDEYKRYYSRLTDVVRRYLEEDAAIDALESTSDELMNKLILRKDAGTLDLNSETLRNLEKVLQQADLVKFARSIPSLGTAIEDRSLVEKVVVETKEALPQPTQEELEASERYQRQMERKRRIQKVKLAGIGFLTLCVLVALGAIAYYGFTPVKDTLFRYPTKVLIDGRWVKSHYGTPPISISTPKVMLRNLEANGQKATYSSGNPITDFYVDLYFEKRTPSDKELSEEEQQAEVQTLLNNALQRLEEKGASNVLSQNETYTTAGGEEAIRIGGSLDFSDGETVSRSTFVVLLFPFESATVELTMIYPKEDRYGLQIENQIVNSIEILKEL